MGIVLASSSPRRRELLKMIGITDFKVIPPDGEETFIGARPDAEVCAIAAKKASRVLPFCEEGDIIIAADTLVYLDGEPLGKPDGPDGAKAMLRRLSGKKHMVYTGLALLRGEDRIAEAEATAVFFRNINDSEIEEYVKTGEPLDKAGAYGAQGRGAVFIERVEGDFFNVVGLPLCRLSLMLGQFR